MLWLLFLLIVRRISIEIVKLVSWRWHAAPGPEVIKMFVLNSAEHGIFSANKYVNANYCWHFHIYKQRMFHAQLCFARKKFQLSVIWDILVGKYSCLTELSTKKSFVITLIGTGRFFAILLQGRHTFVTSNFLSCTLGPSERESNPTWKYNRLHKYYEPGVRRKEWKWNQQ